MPRQARRKRQRQPKGLAVLTLRDYQYPGERPHYWQSVGAVVLFSLWIAGAVFWQMHRVWPYQWTYLPLWVILTPMLVNYLAARPRRQQLKRLGSTAKVRANHNPQCHALQTRFARLAGLRRPPEMYVIKDDAPYLYTLPDHGGTVIASEPLLEMLSTEELATLVAHEIGHIKSHHLRLDLAMTYVDNVNLLLKVAFGPVTVWRILMGAWRDVIEYSADRVAVLLTQNPVALMRAIIKSRAAADAPAELSHAEIDAYLEAKGTVGTDAAQIERLFKITQFIQDQPNMSERLQEIGAYVASDEAKQAFEKLAAVRKEMGAG